MTAVDNDFVMKVLALIEEHDLFWSFFWRTDEGYAPITFMINTNDLFCWGCADAEKVTPENFDDVVQAIKDCEAVLPRIGKIEGLSLFACRLNKMRPQGAAYPQEKELWPLFDACGPERETGIGNPYTPEQKWQKRQEEYKARLKASDLANKGV